MSSLTPEAYAVIEGRHSDPFRYLGPHLENGASVVRVFLPDAEEVAVIDDEGHERDLHRIHERAPAPMLVECRERQPAPWVEARHAKRSGADGFRSPANDDGHSNAGELPGQVR